MQNHVELITDKSNERKKIMGWYYKLPFMECYHGVVSLNHDLKGSLNLNNIHYHFDDGKGYIEKDWENQCLRLGYGLNQIILKTVILHLCFLYERFLG